MNTDICYFGRTSITQWLDDEEDPDPATWSWALLLSDVASMYYNGTEETRWYIMHDPDPYGALDNSDLETIFLPRNWFNA